MSIVLEHSASGVHYVCVCEGGGGVKFLFTECVETHWPFYRIADHKIFPCSSNVVILDFAPL